MEKIMYLAIDVDDKSFTACGIYTENKLEKFVEFKTKPSIGALDAKLSKFIADGFQLKICYEATYLGFSLYRYLKNKDYDCEVIAPSSIPRPSDSFVKTDRIDARKLAQYYKKEMLTVVGVPDAEVEIVRSVCRSRMFLTKQIKQLKRHILATCRQYGIHYRGSELTQSKGKVVAYFTTTHTNWLNIEINKSDSELLKFNLKMLLNQMEQVQHQIDFVDEEIKKISEQEKYLKKVQSLVCYRGISTLTAMVFITEIGDVKRQSKKASIPSGEHPQKDLMLV